jgi:hypothetical protein
MDPTRVLAGLPASLRDPLIQSYREIVSNFIERRWEPAELNGGKFCEIVHTILDGAIKGRFAANPTKPRNMADACRALEGLPADPNRVGDRSLRILIPRALPVLYEIRNNRGVGHVGGDVDANQLDATAVEAMASWVMAELVRVFHGVTTKEAQEVVEALIERTTPLIWEVEGVKRVQDATMSAKDQTLLLLHQSAGWVDSDALLAWVGYSNPSRFRSGVLSALHRERLIEYDQGDRRARISPLGSQEVERRILNTRA